MATHSPVFEDSRWTSGCQRRLAPRRSASSSRKSLRRSYNQEEIAAVAQAHGFTVVHTEDLSFGEQVAYFNRAEVLVGPTGAAWTNLLFCSAGARALYWIAQGHEGFSPWANIGWLAGASVRFLTHESRSHDPGEVNRAAYWLDPDSFSQALDLTLNE